MNMIKKRFIESLRSSTQEELRADLLSSKPTGFGGIFYESAVYAEATSEINEMTGVFTRSNRPYKASKATYSSQKTYHNEALSGLEKDLAVAAA